MTYTDSKSGKPVSGAGTYVTVFRKQSDGSWKVVFDKGCDACKCAEGAK